MWNRLFKGKSSKDGTGKKKKSDNCAKDSNSATTKKVICDSEEIVDPGPENIELVPCQICSRTFAPSALEKHIGICEKMHIQKRTPFDSFRQRREGTGLETYLPSNYGLIAKPKTSKLPSPTDVKSIMRSVSSVYDASTKLPSRRVTPTRSEPPKLASQETPLQRRSIRKQNLGPINEVCPHCGRSFGSRAFDRHVEWCAEKSKFTQPSLSAQQHLAKERMQARTKYKAPTLRSKREKNREKYSSLSEFMNNLSDSGGVSIMDFNSVVDPYERGRKSSIMSLSMTSSIASDGGFSDKYDPFISAKRQLEDLFNSSNMTTSTPSKDLKSSEANMTKSLYVKSPPSPTKTPILSKSNFRRTSSLRVPSKKTSPVSFMPKYKPTIQRGISDEGPISSNFMKPEEFDELPVKSHAVIPPDLVPKSPKVSLRDSEAKTPVVFKRQKSNSSKHRNVPCNTELKLNPNDFPLTKTDSLAAFLKFEDDLECVSSQEKPSEKELKDKSNNLNKKTLSELIDNKMSEPTEFGEGERPGSYSRSNHIKLMPIDKPFIKHKIMLEPLNTSPKCDDNQHSKNIRMDENDNSIDSNLFSSGDKLKISNLSKLHYGSNSFFDQPNEATHTPIDDHLVTNEIDVNESTHETSNVDSMDAHRKMERIANLKNINNTDKRNPKRQLQLHKDNLLFDNAVTTGTTDDETDQTTKCDNDWSNESTPQKTSSSSTSNIDQFSGADRQISAKDQKSSDLQDIESLFEDFDLEEFISSFSDNEQFPIFKNYKEMASTEQSTGRTEHGSESISEESEFDDKYDVSDFDVAEDSRTLSDSESKSKHTTFESPLKKPDVTVEAEKYMQSESDREQKRHTTDTKMGQLQEFMDGRGEMSQAERELLESVQELNCMCDDSNSLDLTMGVATPKDELPSPMKASFKSLFLRSPIEKDNNRTVRIHRNQHQPILSYQMPEIVGVSASTNIRNTDGYKVAPIEHFTPKDNSNKSLIKDTKLSSPLNGFDRVLPPIHKNDSQNIYNSMIMASSYHDESPANRFESISNNATERKFSSSVTAKNNSIRTSKFCHECGAKFIIDEAKFCMDCGARRTTLN